ncbi:response regulator [Desulfobacterales bacterium HSG16]|nr:response regulator [Desulfobacterales bacterium HSG16]
MVAAEISRIKGDVMAAADIYDSAIKAAKESGLIQDEAIANELAARFWLGREKKEFAGLYIKKAYNCYRLWGAVRKTVCIEEKHGQLLAINTGLDNSNTMDSQRLSSSDIWMKDTNILDYNSLIKSSIAITGKIHIEELLEELIQILVENTGARTGYLALVLEKNLNIVAEVADENVNIYNKTQYPISACNNLSQGIVNYVRNTMKTVVLNDASSNTRFMSDEYLSSNRIKSVLCTPIIKQKVLTGILYLENSLATNVFNPSRVEMTRILATQAASMLENAYLFNDYKESERKYRALVENMTDIIVRIDCQHRFVYASPSFLQIMSASPDIVGKTYVESGIAESLAVFFQLHIQEIYHNRNTIETEFIIKDAKDQEMRVLNWRFFPEFDDENKMMSVLGISRDITQSRQAEKEKAHLKAQLAQSQKMEAVGTLAGGIAHDFNNILGIILGYSELILFTVNDHSIRSNIDNIMKAGNRAKELIHQLLSFTRKTEQIPKPVKISLIIKETIKLLRSSIPAHIDIRSKISSQNDIVTADPTQIHQILLNLCTNAAHSMDEAGGILDVVLTTDTQLDKQDAENNQDISPGRYLKLVVKDTGSGIDPSIVDKIFDPYFTTKGLGEGTGMGLSMVHGIVKAHKGAITVSSKLEKGSIFTILLPAAEISEVSIPRSENVIPVGSNENILLIDDESMILEVTSKMLERLGYRVCASENPQKALELFQDQKDMFDLVITDMNMPYMTGDMLAMKILAIRPDIPIIICTGYNKRITHEKARELGARKLLAKPLNKQKLAAAVRDVLEMI